MAWYRRRDDARFGEYAASARRPVVVERSGGGFFIFLGSLTYTALALTELLLILRFVFRLFGANPGSTFVSWIYSLSWHIVTPFAGIFNNTNPVGNSVVVGVVEWSTVIAFIIYGIVGSIIAGALYSAGRRV